MGDIHFIDLKIDHEWVHLAFQEEKKKWKAEGNGKKHHSLHGLFIPDLHERRALPEAHELKMHSQNNTQKNRIQKKVYMTRNAQTVTY